MSIFYCRLAKENTKRVYQFLKKELSIKRDNDYQPQTLRFKGKEYTFCFRGKLLNQKEGEAFLINQGVKFSDEKEYLLALYRTCGNDVRKYISDTSFVLIDDGSAVFIYSGDPLYYARKRKGEIYISSEKDYIEESKVFELSKHSSIFFFNDNLKTSQW